MGKVETKDMILYAYRIENEELSTGVSDFTLNLLKKLESEEEQAGKRILKPSEDSSESDLLSYYVLKRPSRRIFGMMMRIAKVKDISTIPPELLLKVIIKPEELRELDISDKESIVCKNRYYFMVDDKDNSFKPSMYRVIERIIDKTFSMQTKGSHLF